MIIFVGIYHMVTSQWFTNFCDWIDDDLWSSISDFFSDIGNFFQDLWSSISDFFSNIGNFFHLSINSNKVAKKFLRK